MKIEKLLKSILDYYHRAIGAGHTHAALYGIVHQPKGKFVVPTYATTIYMQRPEITRDLSVTFDDFLSGKMMGQRGALAFDNSALIQIFSMALKRIEELETKMSGEAMTTKTDEERANEIYPWEAAPTDEAYVFDSEGMKRLQREAYLAGLKEGRRLEREQQAKQKNIKDLIKELRDDYGWGDDMLDPNSIIQHITGLCGCGSNQDFELLWEVLEWCDSGDKRHLKHGDERDEGCYRSPAWELAAKVLDHAGLITHGTGIGWPWTELLGKELLEYRRINPQIDPPEEHKSDKP